MKPPAEGIERFADGALGAASATDTAITDIDVTRGASEGTVLPQAADMPTSAGALIATIDAILVGMGFEADGVVTSTAVDPLPLAQIVIDGLTERADDAAIDADLEAGFAADLSIPAALITTIGGVDTPALLASIVAGAKARMGEQMPVPVRQVTSYTVIEGDSLAAISIEMYGDIYGWTRLWEANADLLPNPAQIEAGMRLRVPHL